MAEYRICSRCSQAYPRGQRCPNQQHHERARHTSRPRWDAVYNTTRWKKLRLAILNRDGRVCQHCGQPATVAAHRTPFTSSTDPLAWDPGNLEAQCARCNGREAATRQAR